jgi:hypothetical protein
VRSDVEIAGKRYPAKVSLGPLYDLENRWVAMRPSGACCL